MTYNEIRALIRQVEYPSEYYEVLYNLGGALSQRFPNDHIRMLEIGVYHGAGMMALSAHLPEGGLYVGVDKELWGGLTELPTPKLDQRWFVQGLSDSTHVLEIVRAWGPYHLVFIDGDHTYEQCKRDYENYSPMLIDGGVLIFHDVDATNVHPGSAQFWQEFVHSEQTKFHCMTYHNVHPHGGNYSLGVALPRDWVW